MRIAHLVGGGELAGGQAVALRLARAARAVDHDVLFVVPTPGELVDAAHADGFAVERIDVGRTFRFGGALRLAALVRRRRVNVLHTHVHAAADVLGRMAGRAGGAAVVSHLHIERHFRSNRLARAPLVLADNTTARLCARILVVSDATREAFERQGYPAGVMETVHNGVDPAAPVPEHDGVLVAHVGRLAPVKGQRELLEAFATVRPRHPAARLVFFGRDVETGGAYAHELQALARSLGLDGVVDFPGFRPAAELDADLLVLPSWSEGLPLAVLEAMSRGTPVVASRVGGTPEAVVDGETGLLVPPRDVPALGVALDRMLGDSDFRKRCGEAGRRRVRERFDAAAMERRVLEVYDELR